MLLTGDTSTISFFSSLFSTIIVDCSVAVFDTILTSLGEPKPIDFSKPSLLKLSSLPNGLGVSL